jgi:hypothetical protein
MKAAWNPAYAFLGPEVLLAQAWVAGAEGSISEAVESCTIFLVPAKNPSRPDA